MARPENFRPLVSTCATHGEYHQTMLGTDGVVRALPGCPLCAKGRYLEELLGRAAVPPRFRDRTLEGFAATGNLQRRAKEIAEAYVEGFKTNFLPLGTSLVFVGTPGTGKTHLACAILNALLQQQVYGVYTTVIEAVRRVKDTWSKSSDERERDALRKFIRPDLLVLDEVGVQFGSEAEKLILFEIINGRYEQERPTIVISNLDRAGVTANLGERCVDRLVEGGGQIVVFNWESHRKVA